MIFDQPPPASEVALAWFDVLPPLESPDDKATEFTRQLVSRGVDPDLAAQAAIILTYKPIPWAPIDQALVKRAWYQCWDGQSSIGGGLADV